MPIGERIKGRRISLDMTLEDVSKRVGVSRQTIQKYESGVIATIPSDKLEKLSSALNVSPAYLMGWEDDPHGKRESTGFTHPDILPMPEFIKKPRLGVIACGKPILAVEESDEFDYVPAHVKCDFTLKCKGDSMINARILDGDIVCIRSQPEVENGQIAAVLIDDEVTLKRVYWQSGTLVLHPENPAYKPLVYIGENLGNVRILGLAVAFLSDIR